MNKRALIVVMFSLGSYGFFSWFQKQADLLNGFSGGKSLSATQLQVAATAFCLSPWPSALMSALPTEDTPFEPLSDFTETGKVNKADYDKGSIYAILYSIYRHMALLEGPKGHTYRFTFHSWGFTDAPDAPVPWILPEDKEPQRHGKACYQGLVEFEEVKEYIGKNKKTNFVEIGSGMGAGGNFITSLVKGSTYLALDMSLAAIDTCNELYAQSNPRLECRFVEGGVGANGTPAPAADASTDVVVIEEAHIAEVDIGPEEEAVFKEIFRMLKPGGFFVWGNAMPTHVWLKGKAHLEKMGFALCGERNHTLGAVRARQEDSERVEMIVQAILDLLWFPMQASVPFTGNRCSDVTSRLIKNFYRHPGTHLYQKLAVGYDSYMQFCFKKAE